MHEEYGKNNQRGNLPRGKVTNHGVKRGKPYRLFVLGMVLGAALSSGANRLNERAEAREQLALSNNVCIEYQVQEGDTEKLLKEEYGIKDIGFSHLAVKGAYRDNEILYAGDVVIGRTTKEMAEKLQNDGYARIISIDEAVELLENNHSLIGEFRKYAEGKSEYVFYVPTGKSLG